MLLLPPRIRYKSYGLFTHEGSRLPLHRSFQHFRHAWLLRPFCLHYRRCHRTSMRIIVLITQVLTHFNENYYYPFFLPGYWWRKRLLLALHYRHHQHRGSCHLWIHFWFPRRRFAICHQRLHRSERSGCLLRSLLLRLRQFLRRLHFLWTLFLYVQISFIFTLKLVTNFFFFVFLQRLSSHWRQSFWSIYSESLSWPMHLVCSVCWEVSPPSSDLPLPVIRRNPNPFWLIFNDFVPLTDSPDQAPCLTWRWVTISRFGSPVDSSLFHQAFRLWCPRCGVTSRNETQPVRLHQLSKKNGRGGEYQQQQQQ